MKKLLLIFAILALSTRLAPAADPAGNWLVADKSGVIRIAACGNAYCGTIASTSKPGRDEHNPDPSKRDHSIVGTRILLDMKPAGPNRWDGKIYNPENGKIYTGHIALTDPNTLRVEGCLLMFCGGQDWTRSPH